MFTKRQTEKSINKEPNNNRFPSAEQEKKLREHFCEKQRIFVTEKINATNGKNHITETIINRVMAFYYGFFFVNLISNNVLISFEPNRLIGDDLPLENPLHWPINLYSKPLNEESKDVANYDPQTKKINAFLSNFSKSHVFIAGIMHDLELYWILVGIHESVHFLRDHLQTAEFDTQSLSTTFWEKLRDKIKGFDSYTKEEFLANVLMAMYVKHYRPKLYPQVKIWFEKEKSLYKKRRKKIRSREG